MKKQFKRVGTHSGRFHADEVMSTAILKEMFDLKVVRSRDPEVLNELDMIYDVGEGEFDHHQAEKKYRESGIPYAACGLIWNRFGRDIIRIKDQTISDEDVESIFYYLDHSMIEGIDAVDNGIKTSVKLIPTMNISSIITEFNPSWDSCVTEDNAFYGAVNFASRVFGNMLGQSIATVKAKSKVVEAYNKRIKPQILVLERSYPWSRLLYGIDINEEILFVIFPKDDEHMIQTVRKNNGEYGDRKRLPVSWAGKRDGELRIITGVEDAVFCHEARFVASARSLEGALKMAELALAEPEAVLEPKEKKGLSDVIKKLLFKKRVKIRLYGGLP